MTHTNKILAIALAATFVAAGCMKETQQKVISATAVGAIAAEQTLEASFDATAEAMAIQVESEGLEGAAAFEAWCGKIQDAFEAMVQIECAILALGELAIIAQDILDHGTDAAWLTWVGDAISVAAVILSAWEALDTDPPDALVNALEFLRELGEPSEHVLECEPAGVPEGCPGGGE